MTSGPMDPSGCGVGKHTACSGTAWDNVADAPTFCTCSCHGATDALGPASPEWLAATAGGSWETKHWPPREDLDPMLTGNHDPAIDGPAIDHWPMGDATRVEF